MMAAKLEIHAEVDRIVQPLLAKLKEEVTAIMAKAKDEQQEDDAAPAELPAVGDVWGVPGKPKSWRYMASAHGGEVQVCLFGGYTSMMPDAWQQWIKDTGAVRIDDARARVKELEAEVFGVEEEGGRG